MTRRQTPVLLAILDGLALNPNEKGNAVLAANTPVLDRLLSDYPHTTLTTFGPRVGLPEGQMGNSEVGHLNIGAGRIVRQDLTRISVAVSEHALGDIPAYASLISEIATDNFNQGQKALHLIGLVSTGGVHSSLEHLEELISTALRGGVKQLFVHAITDGRDRPPQASLTELGRLVDFLEQARAGIAPAARCELVSICGRYYAMDRDKRWERTSKAYQLWTNGVGERFDDPIALLKSRHSEGQTDEFILPAFLRSSEAGREAVILSGDAVVFANFRADRMRQIVHCFLPDAPAEVVTGNKIKLSHLCTLTEYEQGLAVEVLFPPQIITNHIGSVVGAAGLRQLRIAETEKYAHVTYFFNGGAEEPSPLEERIMVPSPRDVATYDLKPEMSAQEVTDKLLAALSRKETSPQFIVLNFANCDMVGHTGDFSAAVRAVETVDRCLGMILARLEEIGGVALVTADHGNADQMVDYTTGEPHTYHTLYPVPFILFASAGKHDEVLSCKLRDNGALCDIAPTICDLLDLPVPREMTGQSLLIAD